MKRVILETPYRGNDWKDIKENLRFARLCARDCLVRGEAPFASHLLYTQDGILDDKVSEERRLGIEAGFAWKEVADATVVYINRGIYQGMYLGIRKAISQGQRFEYRNLPDYTKAPPPAILTITGASGVGKTTIVGKFLEARPSARLITSFTTRSQRESDLPGEYEYNVPREKFERNRDEFLWIVSAHGNTYGTSKESIAVALRSSRSLRLMLLVPDGVQLLRKHLSQFKDYERLIKSFYVLSPGQQELRNRLNCRGENENVIPHRLEDCRAWDETAVQSDIPYVFLSNNEPNVGIEMAVQQMCVFL